MSIRLITNPAADADFRNSAEGLLADGAASPTDLELRLQRDYPRVSVVRGIDEPGMERWYAYRDGHWINPAPGRSAEPAALGRAAALRPR
jgi:hypothetical protein